MLFSLGNRPTTKKEKATSWGGQEVAKEESVELFTEFSMEVAVEQVVEEVVVERAAEEDLAVEVEDVGEAVEAVEKLIRSSIILINL